MSSTIFEYVCTYCNSNNNIKEVPLARVYCLSEKKKKQFKIGKYINIGILNNTYIVPTCVSDKLKGQMCCVNCPSAKLLQ